MRFVQAQANEFLVVSRGGRLEALGIGARAFLWPGTTAVTVPSTKQEAAFAMTQESKDGIPLRFKGIAVYRVVDPVAAALAFGFTDGRGHEQVKGLIAHICLGELRDAVSHMTLAACIEERKTTLTERASAALAQAIRGASAGDNGGWGIAVDVVQVAQVFIVDDVLRQKLEAGLLNEVAARAERSNIQMREAVELERARSASRLARQGLEDERERQRIAREKLALAAELKREQIETETPVTRLELTSQQELGEVELDMRRVANEVERLRVDGELLRRRAEQTLELEALPVRQLPELARALGGVFADAHLTVIGEADPLLRTLTPLVELVAERLKG